MSTANVNHVQNLAGLPPTTPTATAGDRSQNIANTSWVGQEISTAVPNNLNELSAGRPSANYWVLPVPNTTQPTQGLTYRVRFQIAASAINPEDVLQTSGFGASSLARSTPDSTLYPNTWTLLANLVASTATTGPRPGRTARIYSANGTTSDSEVRTQNVSLSANTQYILSCWVRYIGGTAATAGAVIAAQFNNGSTLTEQTTPINTVPTDGRWYQRSVIFTNGNALPAATFAFLKGLNTSCQYAIDEVRLSKLEAGPRIGLGVGGPIRPLTVVSASTGEKQYYFPSVDEFATITFDGVDWVVQATQHISNASAGQVLITGTPGADDRRFNASHIGRTIVINTSSGGNPLTSSGGTIYLMPALVSAPNGGSLRIINRSDFTQELRNAQDSTSSGDVFYFDGSPSGSRQIDLPPKTMVTLHYLPGVEGGTIFVEGNFAQPNTSRNSKWQASLPTTSGDFTTGYQVLPSGLMIQWGAVWDSVGNANNIPLTFPVAFPTACHQVLLTDGGDGMNNLGVNAITSVGCRLYGGYKNSSSSGAPVYRPTYFRWLAIGR